MIDPHAPRRPDAPRLDWLRFRRRLLLGSLLVLGAVLASVATEPVVSLLGRDLSGRNVGVGIGLTAFNLVMFAIAQLVPPMLVAAGVALPLVGIYQYREVMLSPRRRGVSLQGAMPVGRATTLGWVVVAGLVVVAVVGIVALNTGRPDDAGIAEPHLIYDEPGWFVPD